MMAEVVRNPVSWCPEQLSPVLYPEYTQELPPSETGSFFFFFWSKKVRFREELPCSKGKKEGDCLPGTLWACRHSTSYSQRHSRSDYTLHTVYIGFP